jgi:hypothetical protein
MRLKCLAISDTHVGEPNSLLSFPRGLQELWYALRTKFNDNSVDPIKTPLEVDELILLGDIPDRTLSSTSEIQTQTGALIRTLLSVAKVKRLVYVIGNHDHTLWTNYISDPSNPEMDVWKISEKPEGINIIDPNSGRQQAPKTEEILSIFFEYPYGTVWNDIVEGFGTDNVLEFVLANPIYARQFSDRLYVFAHGTGFRPDVCSLSTQRLLAAGGPFADLNIVVGEDVKHAADLADYEYRIHRFVDTIWESADNNPRTKADEIWYLRRLFRFGTESPREIPDETALIPWKDLEEESTRIEPLVAKTHSLKKGNLDLWQKNFLRHMMKYLHDGFGSLNKLDGITFVYGDTHEGGWGNVGLKLATNEIVAPPGSVEINKDIIDIRIANTGGWIVEEKDRHPACHAFAVDDSGKEYILDMSYKDIKIGDDFLLNIAEKEYENRLERLGDAIARIEDFFHGLFS